MVQHVVITLRVAAENAGPEVSLGNLEANPTEKRFVSCGYIAAQLADQGSKNP
jgi:hypothetical protein